MLATREVTGTFTTELSENGAWEWAEFVTDDGITAQAEFHAEPDYERSVWGVKVLDEGERSRGVGTALMSHVVAHADAQGWNLWLKCEPAHSGEWIVAFYERFGFRVTFTTEGGRIIHTMHRDRSNL
jgi:GNAT superfamily N-acetyltransferase